MTLQPWPLGLGPLHWASPGRTGGNPSGQSNFQWAEPLPYLSFVFFLFFYWKKLIYQSWDITINNEARVECPHILKPGL